MRVHTEGKGDMMRRTRFAAATVMVAAGFLGAVAAPASAGTHKLVDNFDGGTLWMKVKVDKGKPKFVKDIRLFFFGAGSLDCGIPPASPILLEVPGRIRVKAGTKPPEYGKSFEDFDPSEDFSELDVRGTLRKKGKLSTGRMNLTLGEGSGACFLGRNFEAVWVHGACETCNFDKAAGLRE